MAKNASLLFPGGGLHSSLGYQHQPPYTSGGPLLNVRPRESIEERLRGGSRPGARKHDNTALGSPSSIRFLNQVRILEVERAEWFDDFSGYTNGPLWTDPATGGSNWIKPIAGLDWDLDDIGGFPENDPRSDISSTAPRRYPDGIRSAGNMGTDTDVNAAIRDVSDLNNWEADAGTYQLNYRIKWSASPSVSFVDIYFYLCVDRSAPLGATGTPSSGISIGFRLYEPQNEDTSKHLIMGYAVAESGAGTDQLVRLARTFDLPIGNIDLQFDVNETAKTVVVTYNGGTGLQTFTITCADSITGKRDFGFGIQDREWGGRRASGVVKSVHLDYPLDPAVTAERNRTLLVAGTAASDGIYVEGNDGVMNNDDITNGTITIADKSLATTQHLQSLYIADRKELTAKGTDGVVSVTGTDTLTSDSSSFVTAGVTAGKHVLVITDGGTGASTGTYEILSVDAGGKILTMVGTSYLGAAGSTVSFRVVEKDKKITWVGSDATLAYWNSDDSTFATMVPADCEIIGLYNDRVVLAAPRHDPHNWFMSELGNPLGWDFSLLAAGDVSSAINGTNTEAGRIAEPITAFANHTSDYAIFGARNSLWILRGDPAFGGRIDNVSTEHGIIDKFAWCKGPANQLVFLSHNGLYELAAGGNTIPQALSKTVIPRELVDVDTNQYDVLLAYDIRFNGVLIFLVSILGGTSSRHWWYDWETRGFFPFTFDSSIEPTALHYYKADVASRNNVILGGRDGYLRVFDYAQAQDQKADDTGLKFATETMIGPVPLSTGARGVVDALVGVFEENSGSVNYELFVGESPEAAYDSDAAESGVFAAGTGYSKRVRRGGESMYLKLSTDGTAPWAMERIEMERRHVSGRKKI